MRNWIRTAVICAVMAWSTEPLHAFNSDVTALDVDDIEFGRCFVGKKLNYSEGSAWVTISPNVNHPDSEGILSAFSLGWWASLGSDRGLSTVSKYFAGGGEGEE